MSKLSRSVLARLDYLMEVEVGVASKFSVFNIIRRILEGHVASLFVKIYALIQSWHLTPKVLIALLEG